jgi:thioredoxin-like negative regulator of GroEL
MIEVIELDEEAFREFIKKDFAVVEFYTDYCPYCRMLTAILDPLCQEIGVDAGKINVGRYLNIRREYEIELVPTVIVFSKGDVIGGFMGFTTKSIAKAMIGEKLLKIIKK